MTEEGTAPWPNGIYKNDGSCYTLYEVEGYKVKSFKAAAWGQHHLPAGAVSEGTLSVGDFGPADT